MHHKKTFFVLLGVLLSAILVGCTMEGTSPEPVMEPTEEITMPVIEPSATVQSATELLPTNTVSETQPAATPTIDVDALIREKLSGHHSIDRVYAADKTREEWNATLDRMISYGAKISEEEKQIIIDYLLGR